MSLNMKLGKETQLNKNSSGKYQKFQESNHYQANLCNSRINVFFLLWTLWLFMWLTDWLNQLINHKGDCRTAPATPGVLNKSSLDAVPWWMLSRGQSPAIHWSVVQCSAVKWAVSKMFLFPIFSYTFRENRGILGQGFYCIFTRKSMIFYSTFTDVHPCSCNTPNLPPIKRRKRAPQLKQN